MYGDQNGWLTYAAAQICEARRLSNKPVYIFLWPEFEDHPVKAPRAVPAEYWRAELDLAWRMADGIVLWGGWDLVADKRQPWNDDAGWWRETRRFLQEHR